MKRSGHVRGFTLLELMIAVAIMAIISLVAYPSYQSHLRDSRRSEAGNALLGFATALHRYKSDNQTYAGAQSGTGYPNPPQGDVYPSQAPIESGTKFYNLTIEEADADSFVVHATPIAGSAQDGDGYLELSSTGIKAWDRNDNGAIDSGENSWR